MTRLTHGQASPRTAEYSTWQSMHNRCRGKSFTNYAGRGITVCARWSSFESFLADMGCRPSAAHQLDRIDNDGDYSPENCRWSTKIENMRNTRCTRFLTHNGKTQSLAAWAEELGMSQNTLRVRLLRGKPIERVLSTTKHNRKQS